MANRRKLSHTEAIALYRDVCARGMSQSAAARKYGVWRRTVDLLIRGITYRDVPLVRGKQTVAEWEAEV